MSEVLYLVRKHGAVKVGSKVEAQNIIKAAAAEGYKFGQKKVGWSFVVSDLEA